MPQATTTVALIRDNMETLIEALTPVSISAVKYRIARGERKFAGWAELNPAPSFRRYQIRDVGDYELPMVSNTDVELLMAKLLLTMAYPLTHALYGGQDNIQAIEDLVRQDMHQVRDAIGLNGYGDYLDGTSAILEAGYKMEEQESVMLVLLPLEITFYRSMP